MSNVLSSGVFWTAVGAVAAAVAAIAAVIGLRARSDGRGSGRSVAKGGQRHEGYESPGSTPSPVGFGSQWGKLTLPLRARIGVIDESNILELGLSATQLQNIGLTGEFNAVVVAFLDKKTRASLYNAFGMRAMEGSNIRISSALAEHLGCHVGEEALIEGLAVL